MKNGLKLFLLFSLFFASNGWGEEDPFRWGFDGSSRTVSPGGTFPFEVSFEIPKGYYLYREKISLVPKEGEGLEAGPLEFPPPVRHKDPFFGKEKEIYPEDFTVRATLKVPAGTPPGDHLWKLVLTYQGCSEGLCYRQVKREIPLPVQVIGGESPQVAGGGDRSAGTVRGFLVRLGLSFLGGLATDFTPCILPIIPITLAFIGVKKGSRRSSNFFYTLIFVTSMALTYAALGVVAALLGKSLGFFFQNIYFLAFVVLLYTLLALSLFGLFEIQVPLSFRNWIAKRGGQGAAGSIVSGVTIGFLAAPCVGPLIASLLLYVAQQRQVSQGFVLLFSYGLGMGSFFLVIALFYEVLASKVRSGPVTLWIKRGLAVLLLAPAFYYGSILWAQISQSRSTGQKSIAISPVEESLWVRNPREGLARAAGEKKTALVDFYADWCLPCTEMDHRTFSDRSVQEALARVVPIKVDCTSETPTCREMIDRFGVVGWPTVLFLGPDGKVRELIAGKVIGPEEMKQLISRYSE